MKNNSKKFVELPNKLAFDLAAYDGKDTLFLKNKGYKVVAVEANPKRYLTKIKPLSWLYSEIATENICISDKIGEVDFYLSNTYGVWDSCNIDISQRQEQCKNKLKLKCISVVELITKYGIPEYIKCDIEGNDILMLKTLLKTNIRPKYISCESECQGINYDENKKFEVLDCMKDLGYTKYFLVDCFSDAQNELNLVPYDIINWISYDKIKQQMTLLTNIYEKIHNTRQLWCDIYCS